jgi:hypothetical protein
VGGAARMISQCLQKVIKLCSLSRDALHEQCEQRTVTSLRSLEAPNGFTGTAAADAMPTTPSSSILARAAMSGRYGKESVRSDRIDR